MSNDNKKKVFVGMSPKENQNFLTGQAGGGKKVFVGMSGGVDSSVTAALLKQQGLDVTGVFIKAWHPDWLPCNWKEDRRDAMRVAAVLDIPFLTLDLEKEYKEKVVDYMISEYKKGRTPNPDVMCNKEIKFGGFLKFALENGASFVATGHYARVDSRFMIHESKFNLLEGVDKEKDQSYFLWTITQDQLKNILLPVGAYTKKEIRVLAEKFNLPTANKKDSQGLCFVGKIDLKDFLSEFIETKDGSVLDTSGKVIGTHPGSIFFTIGQRHGFETNKKTPKDMPLYVISKDIEANTITVSEENTPSPQNEITSVELSGVNWINHSPETSLEYLARTRYRQEKQKCQVSFKGDKVFVNFNKPQSDISVGQSLVLYSGEVCLGGGIIEEIK